MVRVPVSGFIPPPTYRHLVSPCILQSCVGLCTSHSCMRLYPRCLATYPTFSECRTLGGIHGIPRVHYKGRQGDYYIMVGVPDRLLTPCHQAGPAHQTCPPLHALFPRCTSLRLPDHGECSLFCARMSRRGRKVLLWVSV